MIKTGIYPGTFDPITFGHIDVVKRSLKIPNKLIQHGFTYHIYFIKG